jgi:3-oxoacyl-[acyl-carrier protein] reductase
MAGRLNGRTAWITGSSRNVGRAVALAFAHEGAAIVTHGFSDPAGAEATAEAVRGLGVRAVSVTGDVGDPEAVTAMAQRALAELGAIDILVNCPGYRPREDTLELSPESWRRVMATNLDGAFFCAQAVLPGMVEQEWGRIINVAGTGAFVGEEGQPHVSASKAGLLGLTRSLAREFGDHNILVNTVSPGLVLTEDSPYRNPGRDYEPVAAKVPTRRIVTPEEIADLCVFLCLPEQRAITGQTIHINGGTYLA